MISGTSDPVGSNEGENTSEYHWRSSLSDTDACEMSESSESNAQPRGRWGKTFVPRTGEKPHRCLSCGRCFSTSSGLALHRCAQASEGPHTCQTCSKTFISSSHLATHLRTHAGEKRYKCTLCNKVFAQPAHLVRHRAVHTGEKSFRCPDCSRSFGRASHLKTHHRLHTGEKPFRCTHCEKAFTQKAGLIMHLRQHTGERPFKCGKCGKGFRTSAHLLSHQALESGEGRHTCARCLKGFRSVMALRQHERSHGGRAVESEPRGWGLGGGATAPHCSVCCSALVSSSHLQPGCPVGDLQCVYHCKVCSRMFSRMSAFERHCQQHLRQLSRARDTGETDDDQDPLFLPHMAASPQYTSEVNTRSKTRAKRQMEASD